MRIKYIRLQAQAQPVIKDSLRIIGDLVENVLNEITQTKTLCFNCVKVMWDVELLHILSNIMTS